MSLGRGLRPDFECRLPAAPRRAARPRRCAARRDLAALARPSQFPPQTDSLSRKCQLRQQTAARAPELPLSTSQGFARANTARTVPMRPAAHCPRA